MPSIQGLQGATYDILNVLTPDIKNLMHACVCKPHERYISHFSTLSRIVESGSGGSSVIAAVTIPKASSVVAKSVRLCEQGCARMEWLQRLEFMVDISLYI